MTLITSAYTCCCFALAMYFMISTRTMSKFVRPMLWLALTVLKSPTISFWLNGLQCCNITIKGSMVRVAGLVRVATSNA